jgi:hypothetical protein
MLRQCASLISTPDRSIDFINQVRSGESNAVGADNRSGRIAWLATFP